MSDSSISTDTLTGMSALKLAVMAQQARQRYRAIATAEPIAIVGIGCRFPGGANDPESYWNLLAEGVDAVGPVPTDRWDVDAVYDPDPAAPGKSSVAAGGFIDGVDLFDAEFFGIMRREAERMDPQHRLVLEVAVDALDHAGIALESLAGSAAGVFIASYYSDYALLQLADPDAIDARTLTGIVHSVLANRLSYLFDLRGPSVSIDTACSSSLVAVHMACQSLRTGDSDVALAGGVSLMLTPDFMIALSKVGFISPTGRCRTFDADADGFIRGEGCGMIVLKRLSDAIADGDRVLAVIRGSSVNQDGHSTVLSAPNGLAQQELLRSALVNAQLTADRVGYVEAHGTGTPLGDPIEVEALAATIGRPRADGGVCYLGSAKANIGHLEAAAGIAGLIKATLMLHRGEIPRQPNFRRPNPHLSLDRTCLLIADQHRAWPSDGRPRVAGVSGFGVGGTNAHVLVEEAPDLGADAQHPAHGETTLLPVSARSAGALRAMAERWAERLDAATEPLADLAAAAGARRSHHDHRLAVVGATCSEVARDLRRFVDGDPAPTSAVGRRPSTGSARIAFVFSGQGPQWPTMGRELLEREPVYARALGDVDACIRDLAGWSVRESIELPEAQSRLGETEFAQPAIFATQVALAALWSSWGIEPDIVVGHSVGELAAFVSAGVLSLEEAARIVVHRGRIMQRATGLGRMMSAALDPSEAADLVRAIGGDLSVGAVNAPRSVVLSGAPEAVAAARAELDRRGVGNRDLPVTYAFHSAQMAPFERELVSALGRVTAAPATRALYSTVTGQLVRPGDVDAAYFGRNVRQTVRFADAVASIIDSGVDAFVEVAPHPVLANSVAECVAAPGGRAAPIVASMRRGRPARSTMLQACAELYALGRTPSWPAVTGPVGSLPDMPSYPWQRQRYWLRERPEVAGAGSRTAARHPLLGDATRDGDGVVHHARWDVPANGWIADHRIGGETVMPVAALLDALHAAARLGEAQTLVDVVVHHALVRRPSAADADGWVVAVPDGASGELTISTPDGHLVASASVGAATSSLVDAAPLDSEWTADAEAVYDAFADLGAAFGPAFRTIVRWRAAGSEAEGVVRLVGDRPARGVHPTLVDGALQLCSLAASARGDRLPDALLLPIAVERFVVAPAVAGGAAPSTVHARVSVERQGAGGSIRAVARLTAEDGSPVALLDGVRFTVADEAALAALKHDPIGVYEERWEPVDTPGERADASGAWLVLADDTRGPALMEGITAAGGACRLVLPNALDRWDTGGLAALVSDPAWRAHHPLRGVVHAWALAADDGVVGTADRQGERDDWPLTGSALALVQALASAGDAETGLWLVTSGSQPATRTVAHPRHAGLWGLAAVVAAELPDMRCRVIDIDEQPGDDISVVLAELLAADGRRAIARRSGSRFAPTLRRRTPAVGSAARPARLEPDPAGELGGVAWAPHQLPAEPSAGDVRLRVLASGVNFRDVLLSLGMYPGAGVLGGECVGQVEAVGRGVSERAVGEIVYGFAMGSLATVVDVAASFVRPMPSGVTVEQAAALPVAFLTAMYGLEGIASIGPGSRVLVHAGAGGVGLAAIQVARRRGAEVFATVGSPRKADELRARGVEHIFDSRSESFADGVLAATGGAGVDVVLNSLTGPLIEAGLRTLVPGGVFLELGKRDIWTADRVAAVRPDVRYVAYDLGDDARAGIADLGALLDDLSAALASGAFSPLPVRVYDATRAADAMRWMAQARHVGKLVIRVAASPGRPVSSVRPDGAYLVTGGAGALGLHTAQWLAAKGAGSIVLTGRSQPSAAVGAALDELRAGGVDVRYRSADAGDESAMRAVIDEIERELPPLRGVVHAAGVVDDGILAAQTPERWRAVLSGKAGGAELLDRLTRAAPLDFFVLYSAAGRLLGPAGQGAYPAANAELDSLAWARRTVGLPAVSVQWGQWSDGGMAARMVDQAGDVWTRRGLGWIDPPRAFAELERLLDSDAVCAAVLPIDWSAFARGRPAGFDEDYFAHVVPRAKAATVDAERPSNAPPAVTESWRAALPLERRRLVLAHAADKARQVLGVDEGTVLDPAAPLKDAGLDSLMAVELRNVLTRSLATPLPATLLFDYPSLDALTEFLMAALDLAPAAGVSAAERPAPPTTNAYADAHADAHLDLAELSDEEAEALLLAELGESSADRSGRDGADSGRSEGTR